jgi:hypothetical protein
MQPQAGIHNPAQTSAPLDFLSRFSPNQRMLVRQLYQAAAAQRYVTRVASVQFAVARQLTLRVFHSLGESEGEAYGHSLTILRDHKQEAEQYATAVLRSAGKLSAASQKKGAQTK